MCAFAVCLTVVAGASAAPVPKDEPSPTAKALVGTWQLASNDVGPPWGSAVVTFAADGKLTATFGTPDCKKGFGDVVGTYRVNRDTLNTATTHRKGTPTEFKRNDVLTIIEIGPTKLRMVYQNGAAKDVVVLERVKDDNKQETPPKE